MNKQKEFENFNVPACVCLSVCRAYILTSIQVGRHGSQRLMLGVFTTLHLVFESLSFVFYYCIYMCVIYVHKCGQAHARPLLWRSEDSFWESVFSFHLGSEDQARFSGLSSKHVSLPNPSQFLRQGLTEPGVHLLVRLERSVNSRILLITWAYRFRDMLGVFVF